MKHKLECYFLQTLINCNEMCLDTIVEIWRWQYVFRKSYQFQSSKIPHIKADIALRNNMNFILKEISNRNRMKGHQYFREIQISTTIHIQLPQYDKNLSAGLWSMGRNLLFNRILFYVMYVLTLVLMIDRNWF